VIREKGGAKQEVDTLHLTLFDRFLFRLASSLSVDLIPGETDPSNFSLPQQPFNPFLLPTSSTLSSLNRTTNPYECSIDGVRFLGTSGQNTKDLGLYMDVNVPFFHYYPHPFLQFL
jgi:DNA polymerase delta subunit 2